MLTQWREEKSIHSEKMALSVEDIEREIAGLKAAIKAHETGMDVNKLVLKTFEAERKKYPASKPRKNPLVT